MKRFSALITAFIAVSMLSLSGWAGEAVNPRQPISRTRTPGRVQNFPAGNVPGGITSDGNDIWVADEFDNAVTKLRRSDGVIEGVFPVGREPKYLVFDGANIWVTNYQDGRVTKLRAS